MKNATAFEKRQHARRQRHELIRQAKRKRLRIAKGPWKNHAPGSDPLPSTAWRLDHRINSDPSIIRRSKFKRHGVPRKEE